MPSRYPVEVRKQVVELARSGTRVAQLAETFGMSEAVIFGLAARFGFIDQAQAVWTAILGAQPFLPTRSGVLIVQTLDFPFGGAPLATGASSSRQAVEAHEFALLA
jgi:hypothetical protein